MALRRSVTAIAIAGLIVANAAAPARADDHTPAWVSVFDGHEHANDEPRAVVLSPGGTRVYASMVEDSGAGSVTAGLVAYSATTGHRFWNRRVGVDRGTTFSGVGVDPTGARVFAVGGTYRDQPGPKHALAAAFDAASGTRQWLSVAPRHVLFVSAAVSPDGTRLYASGVSPANAHHGDESVVVAYDADTGAIAWTSRFSDVKHPGFDNPTRLLISPDGSRLFLSGTGAFPSPEYLTSFALSAADGHRLWRRTYAPHGAAGAASAAAISPDGATFVVTGWVGQQATTVAYDTATGSRKWVAGYDVPYAESWTTTISPDGETVYIGGQQPGDSDHPYETFAAAYDLEDGSPRWVVAGSGVDAGGNSQTTVLAPTPDGASLAIAGEVLTSSGWELVTHVVGASDGHDEWASVYRPTSGIEADAEAAVVTPDSSRLIIAGVVGSPPTSLDALFLAYDL